MYKSPQSLSYKQGYGSRAMTRAMMQSDHDSIPSSLGSDDTVR